MKIENRDYARRYNAFNHQDSDLHSGRSNITGGLGLLEAGEKEIKTTDSMDE